MKRRDFSIRMASLGLGGLWANSVFADDLLPTPEQTRGPFYPIPEIEKQRFFDVDLTRNDDKSPVAEGEIILVRGNILDISSQPLEKVYVEVWQACVSGRYNHPNDRGESPLDPNFQYWGRMQTGADGAFSFKTIQPGKYPGRTPHIHFRVVSSSRKPLETQMYFESNDELNQKDGIYKSVSVQQQKSVTVGFQSEPIDRANPSSEKLMTGNFQIVLGPKNDSKSTPDM
jgi:protocatechuate 3,4-dioxygenase, beta subunit